MRYLTTDLAGEDVLTGRTGALGLIALNRPRIINSLSLPMVRDIEAALDAFEADSTIAAVLVTGVEDPDTRAHGARGEANARPPSARRSGA